MVPIWKDYLAYFQLPSCYFRIRVDNTSGEVIYEGRGMAKPGGSDFYVRINDICANYLKHTDVDFARAINATRLSRSFVVQYRQTTTASWTTYFTVEFQNDWSYDYSYLNTRDGYQFPITLNADPRQRILRSVPSGYGITTVVRFKDGSSFNVTVPVNQSNDFNDDYNNDYGHQNTSGPGVAMLDFADYPGLASVTMGGITWTVDDSPCYRYVLYYVNAYGGWDTLQLRGNGIEADNWTRNTYDTDYDNRVQQNRGTVDYLNRQEKRWTLRTGWLDDRGASRMHNLLGSPMVFLHDLDEDRILPVGITTEDAPYKTYKNEGGRLVNYEFEVALQQERVRR